MHLTKEQEKMLNGEYGEVVAKSMELLVRVGEAYGAERLVSISHAHVSGISYSNIGRYGLEFILDFYKRGGKARVFTTVNPGCIDYCGLSQVVENKFLEEQSKIDMALHGMGFRPVYTCIPYYYRAPLIDEHLAWGESSAVIFANSVYGARTNREGGPVALASSITGYTYYAGLHILENRKCSLLLIIPPLPSSIPIGAVGLWIGDNIKEIPCIRIWDERDLYEYKILLSSMAASGSHGLGVIEGVTPRGTYLEELEDKVYVESKMLEPYLGEDIQRGSEILGYIGCPHLHPEELIKLLRLLRRRGKVRRGRLLATIPREYVNTFRDIVLELRARGVDIACGTCPVVSTIRRQYDIVVTNSGKAAFYLRRIHGLKVKLASLEEVVDLVAR